MTSSPAPPRPWMPRRPPPPVWLIGGGVILWWLLTGTRTGERIDPYVNLDALTYWVPLLREAATQWRAGVVPLWNPYQALGGPLLATEQVGALYPLNALYLVLDAGWAWLLTGVLHHLIGGLGMYGFCRAVGITRPGALVGSATYAFAALVVGKYIDQPQFLCLAWVPVMFLCAERLLLEPDAIATAALAASSALEILAGHPETVAQSGLLLGAYIGVRVLTDGRSARGAVLPRVLASLTAAAAALALTAVQWLPTFELLDHSVRAIGTLSTAQQAVLSARPSQMATATLGPLALALIGFWTWCRRPFAWFFGLAAVLLALLSVGPATGLFELFRRLPTGTWFRAPVRFLNLWPLCSAVLAAAGAAELQRGVLAGDRRRWVRLGVTAVVAAAMLRIGLRGDKLPAHVGLVIVVCDLLPLAAGAAASVVVMFSRQEAAGAWYWAPGLAAALACALPAFGLARYASPRRIAELYAHQSAVFARLRLAEPARVLSLLPFRGGGVWAKLGTYFEVPVLNDVEPLSLADFRTFAAALRGEAPASLQALSTVFMGEVTPPREPYDSRLLNLAGVRFIVADDADAANLAKWFSPGVDLAAWAREGHTVVFENQAALPRAFFVPARAARAASANCLDGLRGPGFDPTSAVLLEPGPPLAPSGEPGGAAGVAIREYGPGAVRLGVATDTPGFVVLTDAFYPGWTAAVDGVETPILRADCFFRAVRVPGGTHAIDMRYRPVPFVLGGVISAIAFTVMVVGSCARRWGAQRSVWSGGS